MVRRTSPKKAPPDMPDPCPDCGDHPPETTTEVVEEHDSGFVGGDVLCANCGAVLADNVTFQEPSHE